MEGFPKLGVLGGQPWLRAEERMVRLRSRSEGGGYEAVAVAGDRGDASG